MKRLIYFFVILSSLSFVYANDPSIIYEPQPFDVLHYQLQARLSDNASKQITGVCDINFVWINPNDTVFFKFNLVDLTVDSVLYNGTKVSYIASKKANESYRVGFNGGDSVDLKVYYHGVMTGESFGGAQYTDNMLYANGVGFTYPYVGATRHWMPCFDQPWDKATFKAYYILPQANKHICVSNGLEQKLDITLDPTLGFAPDKDTCFVWETKIQTATYLLTFSAGKFEKLDFGNAALPMVVYTDASLSAATEFAYKRLPEMVSAFESRFMAYPFEKVGYVNTKIGSMEHQTMINLASDVIADYYNRKDTICTTVAHELAHQWFGDFVTCHDFRSAWLNESFATFCETVWAESIGGKSLYMSTLKQHNSDYLFKYLPYEGALPLYDFPRASPSSNYPATIYYKGSVVLGLLRYQIGDEAFFTSISHYLQTYGNRNAKTEDIKNEFAAASNKNLDSFFEQWINRAGVPDLKITAYYDDDANGKKVTSLKISQNQIPSYGIYSDLPVEITLSSDTIVKNFIFVLNSKDTVIKLENPVICKTIAANKGYTFVGPYKAQSLLVKGSDVEENAISELTILPTPADSYLRLSNIPISANANIRIINLQGQTVYQQKIPGVSSFDIPTIGLPAGIYCLLLETDKMVAPKTIIISH